MDAVKVDIIVPRSGKNGGRAWPHWEERRITPPMPATAAFYPTVTNAPGAGQMAKNIQTPYKSTILPSDKQATTTNYVGFPPTNNRLDVDVGNLSVVWSNVPPPKHMRTATDNSVKAFKPSLITPPKGV